MASVRYPRQLAMVGVALAMAGCMGAAPSPYGPGPVQPEQQVLVPNQPDDPSTFAEPPPEEVPVAVDPPPEEPDPDVAMPGAAPVPFE